jgi:hypothetical protein
LVSGTDPRHVDQGDAAHPRLPAALTSEMSRLYSAGFSLIPLGGDDSKKPIAVFRDRKRFPFSIVVERMGGAGSATFGIRLGGLLVIDVDTDTPEARTYVEQRFGGSPARTGTSRGFHLYFRHAGPKPKQVRLPGIAIDFKSGDNEYVVGPLSERPGGIVYEPHGRLVAPDQLPFFVDRDDASGTSRMPGVGTRGRKGTRHNALKRYAYERALVTDSLDSLVAELIAFRDSVVEEPADFGDDRLARMAEWFWDLRETGDLWEGSNSVFRVGRAALDMLGRQGEALAFLLYGIIQADHGHKRGVHFAIVPEALRKSGRLKAGKRQIYRAIDLLVALELVELVSKASGRRNNHLYALTGGRVGEEGSGSSLILVSSKDTASDEEVAA